MADRIWVTSRRLYDRFCNEHQAKLELVPNGVDYEHFHGVLEERRSTRRPRPVLGYVGALSSWFDAALVGEVARRLRDWKLLLVGPVELSREQKAALSLPNICVIRRQPYKLLPSLMAGMDVAMIPHVVNDIRRAANPIKLYEYLAASLPVVATPMPEVLRFSEPGVVSCAGAPDAFAEAVVQLALSDKAERRQEIARQHTWLEIFRKALVNLRW